MRGWSESATEYMVLRLDEGHMPGNFFLSEPQLKTTVTYYVKIMTLKLETSLIVAQQVR